MVGPGLHGHASGDAAHGGQQRQRSVGQLHGLVGDGGAAGGQQRLAHLGIGGQVEEGEQHMMVTQQLEVERLGLLDVEDQLGLGVDLGRVDHHPGAGEGILLVGDPRPEACARLHDDRTARRHDLPNARRGDRHPMLVDLGLGGDADDHRAPPRAVRRRLPAPPRASARLAPLLAVVVSLVAAACSGSGSASEAPSTSPARAAAATRAPAEAQTPATAPAAAATASTAPAPTARPAPPTRVEVLARRPHDPGAFTQGLVLVGDRLFESTGQPGRSSVREVETATGEVVQLRSLPPELFGEGLAAVGNRLVQLTWQNGLALWWTIDGLEPAGGVNYEGEGWGLCLGADGRLVHSDGTDVLTFRDPSTFEVLGRVAVTRSGAPLAQLNELECTPDGVWANVWRTEQIVRIDPNDGTVTATVDASGLGPADAEAADVLNGIARRPDGTWLVTGKHWPTLYEVRFVP
jgi:glutamine cyclotransferase